MKKFLFLFWYLSPLLLYAKDKPQYAVDKIDPKVLLTESSVVRSQKTLISLGEKSASLQEERVVTLLNDQDFDDYNYMVSQYNDSERIIDFEVVIYDKNGKEVKSYRQKDVEDISYSGSNLLTDQRLKIVEIDEYSYPFTIEFNYEKKVKNTYLLPPRWELSRNPNSYTERSSLIINKPASINFSIDYRLHNLKLETKEVSPVQIKFVATNIASFGPERYGPKKLYQKPHIILSPHFFEIEGYTGSFEDWNSLGDFYYRLNNDRYELDEEFIEPLKVVVENANTKEEKVKAIYQYMQKRTRYVSIQLGIGGWQSFPAEYVEKNSYGDCKALTTYTKSLLDHFGIESYPVLINAGTSENDLSYDFTEDIAYNGFNHVILAVPEQSDTLWMECTSQTKPFNYLGSFTMDRKGLIVMPDGKSHLVSTPKSDPTKDFIKNKITVKLDENGSAAVKMEIDAKGVSAENLYSANDYLSREEFQEKLANILDLPNSKLIDYDIKTIKDKMEVRLVANFESKNLAKTTGSRLFLSPLQYQRKRYAPKDDDTEDRIHSFILPYSYTNEVDITYILPEGYGMENGETGAVSINENYGSFESKFTVDTNHIDVISIYKQKSGIYDKDVAIAYSDFIGNVNSVKDRMIVLKKGMSH